MTIIRTCASLVLAALLGTLAMPSTAQPAGGRIMTVTRQVAEFSQHEHALADALRTVDHASIDHLLSADFELRDGAMATQPLPRAQWIAGKHADDAVEQMAVHDYGNVVVVSFVNRATKPARTTFVVDVWQKQGEDWKLAVRYQSQLASGKPRSGDIKPTGKN